MATPAHPAPCRPRRDAARLLRALALLLALAALPAACDHAAAERARVQQWSDAGRLGGLAVQARSPTAPAAGARRTLTVAVTGDLKGWISTATLYPQRTPTGLAHLAPLLRRLRGEAPGLVLLDAGDALHGALSGAVPGADGAPPALPIVALMNALGYDAGALGNFDFALGRATLARAREQAHFPLLSGNLVRREGGTLLAPYAVLERDGPGGTVRIGVLGLTTPGAALGRAPRTLAGLRFAGLEAAARRWVPVLRDVEHVDVLIGLFHSGLDGAHSRDDALRAGLPLLAAAGRVAEAGLGFDLVVSGGAHRLAPRRPTDGDTPYGVPILQPGAYGDGLAVARLQLAEAGGRWRVTGVARETLRAAPAADPAALAAVAAPLARAREWLAAPTRVRFRAVPRKSEFYRCAGALSHAVAVQTDGGPAAAVRSLLPMRWDFLPPTPAERGAPLRRAHLYRWMRYGETVVQAPLTGEQVRLLLAGYVRHLRGWRVAPLEVLWPGGLEVAVAAGGAQVLSVRGADGAPLPRDGSVPVWLTGFVWYGGLGLAHEALLPGGAPLREGTGTLREALFALVSGPDAALPAECQRWLALAP